MSTIDRRTLLAGITAGLWSLPAQAAKARFRIGVTDWNLRLSGKPESVALARSLGFEGVQISIGAKVNGGKMPLDNPALIEEFRAASRRERVEINSTCLDILHQNCLKNDKLAEKWIADGIRITAAVGTRVLLLPFFGKCELKETAEVDRVGDLLRDLAPAAEKAGVVLAVENTISGRDNLRILDRGKSAAVQVYYDVGNSTSGGFEILKEIRELGSQRICQVHLKDNPHYLGEGKVDFRAVVDALVDIRYAGFANLETDCPSGNVTADMGKNLAYIRRLMS